MRHDTVAGAPGVALSSDILLKILNIQYDFASATLLVLKDQGRDNLQTVSNLVKLGDRASLRSIQT
jgi:hypothetical protein